MLKIYSFPPYFTSGDVLFDGVSKREILTEQLSCGIIGGGDSTFEEFLDNSPWTPVQVFKYLHLARQKSQYHLN